MKVSHGEYARNWDRIFSKKKQCCERDYDHDGNCDQHPAPCSLGHKPDWSTARLADGTPDILDVWCAECGISGSFRVDPKDINWDDPDIREGRAIRITLKVD